MAEETIESLQAELAAAKSRVADVNNESKGHRLNWQNAKAEADAAKAEAAAAAERAAAAEKAATERAAAAERAAADRAEAAERKATESLTAAQTRAVNADLRIAAKDAGATDLSDVLALLPRDKLKLNADGDVENAAELVAEFKLAKPHLFGGATTSHTTTPPPVVKKPGAKMAMDMTDEEFAAAEKSRAWRK